MYGRDEHTYYVGRFQDVNRELSAQLDTLRTLVQELLNDADGVNTLSNARLQLRAALASIDDAIRSVDQAVALLPTPLAP